MRKTRRIGKTNRKHDNIFTTIMEKEKLISDLQTRLGKTALSERTINEYVSSILPSITSDEQVNDSFWAMHTTILKSFEGNLNHEIASTVNRVKEEFLKAPKPEPTPPNPPIDERYEKLMQEIESLKKQNEETARRNASESLRNAVLTEADKLQVSNRNLWNDVVKSVELTDGMKHEDVLNKAKEAYEAKQKLYFGNSAVPYTADGGNNAKAAQEELDAFFARKASEGKFPKGE